MADTTADERAAGAISSAALLVLETMFFAVVEPEPRGLRDGREMELSIPEESSRVMTTAALGLTFGEDQTAQQMAQVVGEFAGASRENAGSIRARLGLEDGPLLIQLSPA